MLKVYLAAKMEYQEGVFTFLNEHDYSTDWIQNQTDGDFLPELAGRICYASFNNPRPGGNKAYLDRIKSEGHGSVLEHAVFALIFTGVSRSLTHELIRARAGFSYSQLSQRFVDESGCDFVDPPLVSDIEASLPLMPATDRDKWEARLLSMTEDREAVRERYQERVRWYDEWLDEHKPEVQGTAKRKMAREAARAVLPNETETMIYVTANGRAWRTWLEQRCSAHADAEIRRAARLTLATLRPHAPNLFADFDDAGETKYHKV